jgi:hypothetical protein
MIKRQNKALVYPRHRFDCTSMIVYERNNGLVVNHLFICILKIEAHINFIYPENKMKYIITLNTLTRLNTNNICRKCTFRFMQI